MRLYGLRAVGWTFHCERDRFSDGGSDSAVFAFVAGMVKNYLVSGLGALIAFLSYRVIRDFILSQQEKRKKIREYEKSVQSISYAKD